MLTANMKNIITKLESEIKLVKDQIDSFINSCETQDNNFVREEDLVYLYQEEIFMSKIKQIMAKDLIVIIGVNQNHLSVIYP